MTGYTTIHAGSARQALTRLRFICQLADTRSELPISALTNLVAGAVDLVVHVGRVEDRPCVTEVTAVEDVAGDAGGVTFTTTELVRVTPDGSGWRWSGALPVRLSERARAGRQDVRATLAAIGHTGGTDPAGRDPRDGGDLRDGWGAGR